VLGVGVDISARLAAEEALRATMRRLERQNIALSEQSRSSALLGGNPEDSLRAIAELAAETLQTARTSIWFYNEPRTHLSCAHLFERETRRHSMGLELAAADYPAYFDALDDERAIAADDAATDPRTREFLPGYLTPLGITSMLDAPIRVGGRMVGVVCNEHIGPARTWEPDEENFAGSVADLVSLALEVANRRRAEDALREAHASLEIRVADRTRDLAAANERLQELDRLKSEFLATMSHELRTPLNSIIGFTGILRQGLAGPLNDEQKKQLGMVQFSARHLLGLINDLLDLSRIESGRMGIDREDFPIAEVVAEVVQSLTPMAGQKNLALETETDDPALVLHSDRKKCFQILLNFANNAVKFTNAGRVLIAVQATAASVEISVTDTGIGIKPDSMAQLFEAFRQVDGSARRVYEGTGLGLYLCKKLASMLGGSVSAASDFGHGSRFAFTLPRENSTATPR
jgi:signal transduction histidine kinase